MRAALLGALVLVPALALPAGAGQNPVYDEETAADIKASLDEATAVQGVCYGVRLRVDDADTGIYSGTYEVQSGSPGAACRGTVVLEAHLLYTSSYSEQEDSSSWAVSSTLAGGPTSTDLQALGLSAAALLDDGRSEQVLLNAVLSLPALTAEKVAGVVPLVLVEATEAPPAQAAPTGTPGSDRVRQHLTPLVLLGLLLVGSALAALHALRAPRRPASGRYGQAWQRALGRSHPS